MLKLWLPFVIPAEAGIQGMHRFWTPAYAGVTDCEMGVIIFDGKLFL